MAFLAIIELARSKQLGVDAVQIGAGLQKMIVLLPNPHCDGLGNLDAEAHQP